MNWDYEHSILQISGSLYKYYGIDRGHGSDPQLDEYLSRIQPRCIIAVLIDALGTSILNKHLEAGDFFRRYRLKDVSSVLPPTTTAATTAFLTGHSPAENGWLGWNQYFQEEQDHIILFRHSGIFSGRQYPDGFAEERLPVDKIYDVLNEHGIPADSLWPGWSQHNPCMTYQDMLDQALAMSKENRFLYAYWDDLDTFLHEYGTEAGGNMVHILNDQTEQFAAKLPADTVLLVVADHSQIDVQNYALDLDEELCACMSREPALEQRITAFYVRKDMQDKFVRIFRKRFGDRFLLLSKAEVLSSRIFGPGVPSPRLEEFIGDYLSIALTPLSLNYRKPDTIRGNHAGMVPEERYIPVILFNKS